MTDTPDRLPSLSAETGTKRTRRILAIHSGALGDVVLFGHLLSRLAGEVTLVCSASKAHLLVKLGVVDHGLAFEDLPMQDIFRAERPDDCPLAGALQGFDLLVSCFATGDARAERRLVELSGVAKARFLPIRPLAGEDHHLLDIWARELGLRPFSCGPVEPWRISQEPVPRRVSWGRAGNPEDGPTLVIHPGSGGVAKCWPLQRFVELGRQFGGSTVFALGPAECERWSGRTLESLEAEFPVLQTLSLEELAGLLSRASVYVGNDSGPSHLAAALGTPTVAIFGPSDARHFAPTGPVVRVVSRPRLSEISVAEVYGAIAGISSPVGTDQTRAPRT